MAPAKKPVTEWKFRSFAVLDFEMANYPSEKYYKVGAMELCIYGISLNEFKDPKENVEEKLVQPPPLPRVLHKLNLMINPRMAIHPKSERASDLNNYMLENESPFDENAGNLILSFLNHLQKPVCLVAHNGYKFDFPILKHLLERFNISLPESVCALDSLLAFFAIDKALGYSNENINSSIAEAENTNQICEIYEEVNDSVDELENSDELNGSVISSVAESENRDQINREVEPNNREHINVGVNSFGEVNASIAELENSDEIIEEGNASIAKMETVFKSEGKVSNAQLQSETTPERSNQINANANDRKRKRIHAEDDDDTDSENNSPDVSRLRRRLFDEAPTSSTNTIPKDLYKLRILFLRKFSRDPKVAHYAEADVKTLTRLMLHYGSWFVEYAKKKAILFSKIPRLGREFEDFKLSKN